MLASCASLDHGTIQGLHSSKTGFLSFRSQLNVLLNNFYGHLAIKPPSSSLAFHVSFVYMLKNGAFPTLESSEFMAI